MSQLSHRINYTVQWKTERFFREDSSWSKAALAKLRRGIGKELGEIPELLEYILLDLPDEISESKDTERAEMAIYSALTLFAFHQQGKKRFMGIEKTEDKKRKSFGHAVRRLVQINPSNETAVKRRFDKILSSSDLKELSVHARGIIGLLKAADISLDYATFTEDLYHFQIPGWKRNVILRWAQDYFRTNNNTPKQGEENDEKK